MLKDLFNLKQKSLLAIHDLVGIKLLSRLRVKFSHLNEHKFCQVLWAQCTTVDLKLKQLTTFFLVCLFFTINRQKLLIGFLKLDLSLRNLKDELLLDILLYGSDKYNDTINKKMHNVLGNLFYVSFVYLALYHVTCWYRNQTSYRSIASYNLTKIPFTSHSHCCFKKITCKNETLKILLILHSVSCDN